MNMKRLLSLLLVLTMTFSFAACGGNSTTSAATQAVETTAVREAVEATEAIAEDAGTATEATEAATEAEPVINRAPTDTWDTSVEIVTIAPLVGFSLQSSVSYASRFTDLICECVTTAGEPVYLYLTIDDYLASFDAEASVETASFGVSEMIMFPAPVHIDGVTVDADSLFEGASDSIGSSTVIHLGDFQQTSGTVEEVSYSTATAPMVCVYADIVSIAPAYTLNRGSSLEVSSLVCSCTTADGSTVYMYMSVEDYNAYIDPDASLKFSSLASFETVTYEPAAKFHGISVSADKVASGLADGIGCETVFFFGSKD